MDEGNPARAREASARRRDDGVEGANVRMIPKFVGVHDAVQGVIIDVEC
jgi:hypothetical protein